MQRTMIIASYINSYFRVGIYDLNAVHSAIKAGPISYHISNLICFRSCIIVVIHAISHYYHVIVAFIVHLVNRYSHSLTATGNNKPHKLLS